MAASICAFVGVQVKAAASKRAAAGMRLESSRHGEPGRAAPQPPSSHEPRQLGCGTHRDRRSGWRARRRRPRWGLGPRRGRRGSRGGPASPRARRWARGGFRRGPGSGGCERADAPRRRHRSRRASGGRPWRTCSRGDGGGRIRLAPVGIFVCPCGDQDHCGVLQAPWPSRSPLHACSSCFRRRVAEKRARSSVQMHPAQRRQSARLRAGRRRSRPHRSLSTGAHSNASTSRWR